MDTDLEQQILKKLEGPGWTTARGVLMEPEDRDNAELHKAVERVMREMARKGALKLWKIKYKHEPLEMIAVSVPALQLDRELEERGAWAIAEPLDPNE